MSRDSRQQAAQRAAGDRLANMRLRQAGIAGQGQAAGGVKGQQSLSDLATAMDERKARLGEFAAEHKPGWARATECGRRQEGRAMTGHRARQDREAGG